MKKLQYIMLISTVALVSMLSGCENSRPSSWSTELDTNWEVRVLGRLREIKIVQVPSEDMDYQLIFYDGTTVIVGNIRDYGLIKKDQYGRLYKYSGCDTRDDYSWFQWIVEEEPGTDGIEATITSGSVVSKKTIKNKRNVKPITIESSWERADNIKDLRAKELVLIILDDDIITTWKEPFSGNK